MTRYCGASAVTCRSNIVRSIRYPWLNTGPNHDPGQPSQRGPGSQTLDMIRPRSGPRTPILRSRMITSGCNAWRTYHSFPGWVQRQPAFSLREWRPHRGFAIETVCSRGGAVAPVPCLDCRHSFVGRSVNLCRPLPPAIYASLPSGDHTQSEIVPRVRIAAARGGAGVRGQGCSVAAGGGQPRPVRGDRHRAHAAVAAGDGADQRVSGVPGRSVGRTTLREPGRHPRRRRRRISGGSPEPFRAPLRSETDMSW
jgi:hypothetical protein